MQFLSDNAAAVHPAVWAAMQAADAPDAPYDGDALSHTLDARFSALFGRECAVLWVATGTAANCLALATMVPPHGGVVCHREAHIEMDECGAPAFFTHGAKLMLAEGVGALLEGDMATGKAVLRDYINATLGFEALALAVGVPAKSLMRMFSRSGNPSLSSLSAVIGELQKAEGVRLGVTTARAS